MTEVHHRPGQGPDADREESLQQRVEREAGIAFSAIEWSFLRLAANRASDEFHSGPVDVESRRRIDLLSKRAQLFAASLEKTGTMLSQAVGKRGQWLCDNELAAEMDETASDQMREWIGESDVEYFQRLAAQVRFIEQCAQKAFDASPKAEKGKGKLTPGLDTFIAACRSLWIYKFGDAEKGFYQDGETSRWVGPFVTFTFAAQILLDGRMRRPTPETLGERIGRLLTGDSEKRISVAGSR
jgi:hypothetical protein